MALVTVNGFLGNDYVAMLREASGGEGDARPVAGLPDLRTVVVLRSEGEPPPGTVGVHDLMSSVAEDGLVSWMKIETFSVAPEFVAVTLNGNAVPCSVEVTPFTRASLMVIDESAVAIVATATRRTAMSSVRADPRAGRTRTWRRLFLRAPSKVANGTTRRWARSTGVRHQPGSGEGAATATS